MSDYKEKKLSVVERLKQIALKKSEVALKKKKDEKKKKIEKKRRIILRNLSFKIDEDKLKKLLSKYGTVIDVKIPLKPDGKKRGFAFAQFDKFQSARTAIQELNYKEIFGRPIAIDFALPKDKFESIKHSKTSNENSDQNSSDSEKSMSAEEENTEEIKNDSKTETDKDDNNDHVDKFLREFEFGSDEETKEDEEVDSSSDDDSDKEDVSINEKPMKDSKKFISNDVQEGKTVFIRNISFNTDEDTFREAMEEFGPLKYCLFCIDPITELPKGTAFVKFENKEDAEKLIQKASEDSGGTGVYLDQRKLYCVLAVSRDELKEKLNSGDKIKKDKRNLYLLREGLVMSNSEEAKGVSQADLAKRAKLEAAKKQKLKNLNFFVSDTRLCIHNLPLNYTDKDLRLLFQRSVKGKPVITEARVMKEMNKVDSKGNAKSKGFGFVAFTRHEDALAALRKINNNPYIFIDQKRPIVEFSIENHLALLSKQRREENKKRIKKKEQESEEPESEIKSPTKSFKHEKKAKSLKFSKAKNTNVSQNQIPTKTQTEKKKSKNKKKNKKKGMVRTDMKSFTNLKDQYKTKLLNKFQ